MVDNMTEDAALAIVERMRSESFRPYASTKAYMRKLAARVYTVDGSVISCRTCARFVSDLRATGHLDQVK